VTALLWIPVIVVVLAVVLVYNSLIVKKNRVENAFASIDVMLKKRYDLIPNLVETVKGYASHERTVLEEVTELRRQAVSGRKSTEERILTDNLLSDALSRLLVTVEAYPDLKASDHFLHLQRSLNEVEEQLSASRRAYNAAVTAYNTAIEVFPTSLLAGPLGFEHRTLLATPPDEREVPRVETSPKDPGPAA
jgi:LemA protein